MTCQEQEELSVKMISLIIQDGRIVLKEYEIIMLKYNGKACRLDSLCFCAPKDIIQPGSMTFEGKRCVNTNASWPANLSLSFLEIFIPTKSTAVHLFQ